MASNPYLAAYRLRRRNRRLHTPLGARLAAPVLPLLGAAALVPLFRPVFLAFLDLDPVWWPAGVDGVLLRMGLVLVAILSLDVYTALVRGPDRAVLDLHPVDPQAVVRYEIARVAFERAWLPGLGALLLLPLALEGAVLAWVLAAVMLLLTFALGLAGSALVHLLAVDAAGSRGLAPVLDLIRGSNPREQAAFLYAPGVVLAGCGVLVATGAGAVRAVLEGSWAAGLLLLLLPAVALLAWLPVGRLASGGWFRASGVLADIDARHAHVEGREEALRVYLDWAVRFLPSAWARYALKDLRHGWRQRRAFVTGAWLLGAAAALAGWSSGAAAPWRAAALAAAGAFVCATVAVLLERDEPELLARWLPDGGVPRWGARLLVAVAWLQGCVVLPVLAVAIRHGAAAAISVLAASEAASVLAAVLAVSCGRLRERGLAVYGPLAAVGAAGVAALLLTGVPA